MDMMDVFCSVCGKKLGEVARTQGVDPNKKIVSDGICKECSAIIYREFFAKRHLLRSSEHR